MIKLLAVGLVSLALFKPPQPKPYVTVDVYMDSIMIHTGGSGTSRKIDDHWEMMNRKFRLTITKLYEAPEPPPVDKPKCD